TTVAMVGAFYAALPARQQGQPGACQRLHNKKRPATGKLLALGGLVGVAGFELATPCTPCECATRLRYTPKPAIIACSPGPAAHGHQCVDDSRSRISKSSRRTSLIFCQDASPPPGRPLSSK